MSLNTCDRNKTMFHNTSTYMCSASISMYMLRNLYDVFTAVEICIMEESVKNQIENNMPYLFQPRHLLLIGPLNLPQP